MNLLAKRVLWFVFKRAIEFVAISYIRRNPNIIRDSTIQRLNGEWELLPYEWKALDRDPDGHGIEHFDDPWYLPPVSEGVTSKGVEEGK